MDFHLFLDNYLYNLQNQNEDCIKDIDNNEEIVKTYLGPKDSKYSEEFMKHFIDIVINTKNNFCFIERSLIHDFFVFVLARFKESSVLIKACEKENEPAVRWLLTMDINLFLKDENGMTALMYAVQKPRLVPVVCSMVENDEGGQMMSLTDNNGETALFHAVHNLNAFRVLLDSDLDVNYLNKDKDSVLTYCCKNEIYEPLKILCTHKKQVYFNIYNNDERTAAMYLVKKGRSAEINLLRQHLNFDFKNSKNETALSILIQEYYKAYKAGDTQIIHNYIEIIKHLVKSKVNFNITIDEEGNTPILFFFKIQDYHTILYLLLKCKNLDLSIKNNNGVNASCYICVLNPDERRPTRLDYKTMTKFFLYQKTFDINFHDSHGHNLLMYYLIYNNVYNSTTLLKYKPAMVQDVNDKKENTLIMATRLNLNDIIKPIINSDGNNINQQDSSGNTALHYAVDYQNRYIMDLLAFYHADINIKNNEGHSPLDLAKKSENPELVKILEHPIIPYKILKKDKRNNRFRLFHKSKKVGIEKSVIENKIQEYTNEHKLYMLEQAITLYQDIPFTTMVKNQREARFTYNILGNRGRLWKEDYDEIFEQIGDTFSEIMGDVINKSFVDFDYKTYSSYYDFSMMNGTRTIYDGSTDGFNHHDHGHDGGHYYGYDGGFFGGDGGGGDGGDCGGD